MQASIKAIIFDFGGVLLDWNPHNLYRRFFPDQPQAIDEFLTEINFYEWNAQQDKGRTFAEGIRVQSHKFPQHAHLIQAYFDHWEDSVSGPIPGTVDILKKVKEKNYPLYGLSNWSIETFPLVRNKYPFFDWFDDIIISGEVGLIKPDPAIFNLLLNKTGYSATECVLIDDSRSNIDSAKKLGFVAIHFTTPDNLKSDLQRLKVL